MSSGRASAQVAAALRRTGSFPNEKNPNAPYGNSVTNRLLPNILRYGGQTPLEMRFGKKLRFLANNKRAIQTRQIKSTFLSKQNPDTRLAENVLETELDVEELTPIRICSYPVDNRLYPF